MDVLKVFMAAGVIELALESPTIKVVFSSLITLLDARLVPLEKDATLTLETFRKLTAAIVPVKVVGSCSMVVELSLDAINITVLLLLLLNAEVTFEINLLLSQEELGLIWVANSMEADPPLRDVKLVAPL